MPNTGSRTWKCHRSASSSNGWTSGGNAGTEGSNRRGGATTSVMNIILLTTDATSAAVVDRVQAMVAKLFGRKRLVGLMLQGIVKMIRSGRCHHINTTAEATIRALVTIGFAVVNTTGSVAACTDNANGILAIWRIG